MIVAQTVFGLSFAEFAVVLAAVGYVVSLVKDWRPIKTLRAENGELREALKAAQARIDELEAEIKKLSKATDLTIIQRENRQIVEILDRVAARLEALDGSVKANTAAIELVARGSAIKQALEDEGRGGRAA